MEEDYKQHQGKPWLSLQMEGCDPKRRDQQYQQYYAGEDDDKQPIAELMGAGKETTDCEGRVGSETKISFSWTWCISVTTCGTYVDPESPGMDCLSRMAGMTFFRNLSDTQSFSTEGAGKVQYNRRDRLLTDFLDF